MKEKVRTVFLLLAFLCSPAVPVAAETGWKPGSDQIVHLEQKLVLPPGTRPLVDYGRYYWGTTVRGTKFIRGELDLGRPLGIHIVDGPPLGPTDQGCKRVYVWYEPAKDVIGVQCDGLA